MQKKNLDIFLNEIKANDKKLDKDVEILSAFTAMPKYMEVINNFYLLNLIFYHTFKLKKNYVFIKNKKMYHFRKLSDIIPYKFDKKILHNVTSRTKSSFFRTLKLACSPDLINANLIVASSNSDIDFLIEYEDKEEKYIIDYHKNIVMRKKDYIELYNPIEYSRLDKTMLYKIEFLIDDIADNINILYLLLFPNEIIKDIGKTENWLTKKYDKEGINKNNYCMMGDRCDCLYYAKEDCQTKKAYNDISQFTLNPNQSNTKFSYDEKNQKYLYKGGTKKIYFRLISDYIKDEEIKQKLLSKERYGNCHNDSIELLFGINLDENEKAYLVDGQIKMNEKDYFYHTWIEAETKNQILVLDYVNNIIMDKKDYIELMGARIINRTDRESEVKLLKLIKEYEIYYHPRFFNYFSQELTRDLEKNKFLIKKKETE